MQSLKDKAKLTAAITLVLLIISIALLSNVSVKAQTGTQQVAGPLPSGVTASITITTEAYLDCTPHLIGLGQSLLVNMWLHPPIHVQRQFIGAFSVTFTKPDNTTDTIDGIDSYAGDSSAWFPYVVDQVGTWKAKFDFIGTYFPKITVAGSMFAAGGTLESAYYKPSSSRVVEFTVQEAQVLSWPPAALPTDYWTRPISPLNREWWPIAGNYPPDGIIGGDSNWPADTNKYMSNYEFVPYVQGPNSSHILWRRQYMIGGLIGGAAGQISNVGGGLTGGGFPTIIYSGRCYDTYSKPGTGSTAQTYWRCYDLRTGELYWEQPAVTTYTSFFGMQFASALVPTFIEYAAEGAEVPGATARAGKTVYLVAISGQRIIKWNPWTGAISINITGPPSSISSNTVYGYPYVLGVQSLGGGKYALINWTLENNAGNWVTAGGGMQTTVDNFTARVKGNISWPFSSLGTCDFESMVAVVTSGISSSATGVNIGQRIMAADLLTGALLWNITTDLTTGLETFFGSPALADHGKFANRMQNGQWYCWDLRSGKLLWKSELSSWPWGVFGPYDSQTAYGLIFSNDYNGVHAINWTNGKTEWSYRVPAAPFETPYGGYHAWHSSGKVADGKLYTFNTEHTPTQPITRGWKMCCIDALTGENIWNISCGQGIAGSRAFQGAIADGYLAHTSEYDGYMYVYGKGKSQTTVSAPQTAVTLGQKVMITGTVLDQSPAQPGTPCVSTDSMSGWMEYLHMQQPIPASVTGVPVSLDTLDSNDNWKHIGDVTTDGLTGTFGFMWEPEITGKYTITATFMGDASYGSSFATTYVGVVPAPEATPTPPSPVIPDSTPYVIGIGIAILIAVIIFGVLLLRKK